MQIFLTHDITKGKYSNITTDRTITSQTGRHCRMVPRGSKRK